MDAKDRAKRAAAAAGVARVRPGSRIALGTGSTAAMAIDLLAERFPGGPGAVTCVASSTASEQQARRRGLTVEPLRSSDSFDLMLDGADEVDPHLALTKGGGGALFREKLLARLTREVVILVDDGKLVPRLGDRFPVPVEVVPFAVPYVLGELVRLGLPHEATVRAHPAGDYRTDNGNAVLDVRFPGGLADPRSTEGRIEGIAGVVEVGLFVGLAHRVVVGRSDGSVEERTPAA